ncbi:MAG TPA: amidohydrolase family protein [Candidatus Binataceae bacterium]|nr:amidohydrolase family protein [Candidatus Binataceae bacterium]
MAYELLIKNGTIVDGTGAPRFQADLAIASGRIAQIGKIKEGAQRTVDAAGLVVAPGFFDPHTHYDAQMCWDPLITCSSWHGVTSIVMGNCGVGIAPCRPKDREVATWDLVNVEGIPFDVLNRGITWDWQTFPEFMDAAARRHSALNLGFLAPLTPFRHMVMGEESMERAARPQERAEIKALLKEAVDAGALGFSLTRVRQHIGYQGRPLACRLADRDELGAYANALKELGKGTIEIALNQDLSLVTEEEAELLDFMLTQSARPVTWLGLAPTSGRGNAFVETLNQMAPYMARGGIPQVIGYPSEPQFSMRNPFLLASIESWQQVFNKPPEVQKQIYRDPAFRNAFREALRTPQIFAGRFDRVRIDEVGDAALKRMEGKMVAEIAQERGADALDTFLDLAIEDDLRIRYAVANRGEDRLGALIRDPRTLVGQADGGAHVDMICMAGYPTHMIGTWVREKELLTLEEGVRRLTSQPADLFGFPERGRLAAGVAADITIFDYDNVGCAKRPESRHDLPGGGLRLVTTSRGVEYTIVNGEVLYQHGQHTGALPGQVLRSRKLNS